MATQAAAVFDMGAAVAAMIAQGEATRMRINEGIADYNQEILDIQARSEDISREATRQIGQTTKEGVLALKEQGAEASFRTQMAMTKAEMTASSEEAKLGASGVRAKGSPLLAAQQNVDLAFAAADRTMESGNAGMKLGGVRFGGQLAGIRAQETLATKEYSRRIANQRRKRDELQKNKGAMVGWAYLGGLAGVASSFYSSTASGTFTWGNPSQLGANA